MVFEDRSRVRMYAPVNPYGMDDRPAPAHETAQYS